MKQDIHPTYGPVVFRDRSAGMTFLTRSTLAGRAEEHHERVTWENGSTYPVIDVEISSASHPLWTGRTRVIDTEGRVEKFRRRYGATS